MDDLARIKNALTEIDCEKYFQKFVDEEVDWEGFLALNTELLCKKMSIPTSTLTSPLPLTSFFLF
jgi:hypothetical protein